MPARIRVNERPEGWTVINETRGEAQNEEELTPEQDNQAQNITNGDLNWGAEPFTLRDDAPERDRHLERMWSNPTDIIQEEFERDQLTEKRVINKDNNPIFTPNQHKLIKKISNIIGKDLQSFKIIQPIGENRIELDCITLYQKDLEELSKQTEFFVIFDHGKLIFG